MKYLAIAAAATLSAVAVAALLFTAHMIVDATANILQIFERAL